MTDPLPDCFGNFDDMTRECGECDRSDSCELETDMEPDDEELYEIESDQRLHAWQQGDYGDVPLSQVPRPRRRNGR